MTEAAEEAGWADAAADPAPSEPEPMPVELGGVTRFVTPAEVLYVEAQGDYARLHPPAAAIWCASR